MLLDCFVFFLLSFVEYELLAYFVCFAQAQFFKLVYNDMCNLEFFEKKCFRIYILRGEVVGWGRGWERMVATTFYVLSAPLALLFPLYSGIIN